MHDTWEAFGIFADTGEKIAWRGLREKQAKWRYNFLRRGFLWQGRKLKSAGYRRNSAI